MNKFNHTCSANIQRGFSLLEVIVAVGVFAVGALALAGLQGSLSQTTASAKTRTIAANIAQADIENIRGFVSVTANQNGDPSFADIISTSVPITSTVSNVDFSLSRVVTPYYREGNAFTDVAPDPLPANPNFKKFEVTVGWTDASGAPQSVILTDVISSQSTTASGRTVAAGGRHLNPPVPYTPGARPEVASIDIGAARFKETLTPKPEVFSDIADTQFVMTGFDVITFSQDPTDDEGRFLRREENRLLNCECILQAAEESVKTYQPLAWTGEEYVNGSLISKPYGIPADGRVQDPLCDVCCRDHHDPASPDTSDVATADLPDASRFKYDPWDFNNSQHLHYRKDDNGFLVEANITEDYLEACRLIRSDGFFRVAQDIKITNLVSMPEYYLSVEDDVDEYSDYTTDIVQSFMDAVLPTYPDDLPLVDNFTLLDSTPPPSSTSLPEPLNPGTLRTDQQLRTRAIYIDYLTKQTRRLYDCLLTRVDTGEDCDAPQIYSALEVVPFFELNMTQLADWRSANVDEVSVTNERIPNGVNTLYSRGEAKKTGSANSTIIVSSMLAPSNTGLTNTDAITPDDAYNPFSNPPVDGVGRVASIDVDVTGPGGSNTSGIIVNGIIDVEGGTGINASSVSVFLVDSDGMVTECHLGSSYECTFTATGNGTIVVTGYNTGNKDNAACDITTNSTGAITADGTLSEATSFMYSGLLVGTTKIDILISKNNSC